MMTEALECRKLARKGMAAARCSLLLLAGCGPSRFARLSRLLAIVALGWSTAFAQPVSVMARYPVGTRITPPVALTPAPPTSPAEVARASLACRSICSPFEPGQAITELSWPEDGAAPALAIDPRRARVDITSASGGFAQGAFSTLRVATVPAALPADGSNADVEAIKRRSTPALLQPVRDGVVMPREAAVSDAARVLAMRRLGARARTAEAFAARTMDNNGLGTLQLVTAVAQRREIVAGVPRRIVTLEGLQAGLTYRVALVDETAGGGRPIAARQCRIPVCPADVVRGGPGN
jgi:hypothetical protein